MTLCTRRNRRILITLSVLFACRVVAQLLASQLDLPWLPAFDQWSSKLLSYPLLLASQIVVLGLMILLSARRLHLGLPVATLCFVQIIAVIYFAVMLTRLIIALGGFSDQHWLQLPLPAAFHLVLASYLYCYAEGQRQSEITGGALQCIFR